MSSKNIKKSIKNQSKIDVAKSDENYAKIIEDSISNVLNMDLYTKDINPSKTIKSLSTSDFGDEVVNEFRRLV